MNGPKGLDVDVCSINYKTEKSRAFYQYGLLACAEIDVTSKNNMCKHQS